MICFTIFYYSKIKTPVDKFGRGDYGEASITQHTIVSSGDDVDDVYLRRDGGNTAIGSISMTGNTVTNVCNPTADHDVPNKLYVDRTTNDAVSKNGGIMMGNFNMIGYEKMVSQLQTYQKVIQTLPLVTNSQFRKKVYGGKRNNSQHS